MIWCRFCQGRGCLVCDDLRTQEAREETRRAIARRRVEEAHRFCSRWLNREMPDSNVKVIPSQGMVEMVADAMEEARQVYLQARANEKIERAEPGAWCAFIEFDAQVGDVAPLLPPRYDHMAGLLEEDRR